MAFLCPNCGRVTSSESSLQAGGYWDKYSKNGPWGCPTCQTPLDRKCSTCGCVGNGETVTGWFTYTCKTCGG